MNPPLPFSTGIDFFGIAVAWPKHYLFTEKGTAGSFLFGSFSFAEKEKEHPLAFMN